MVTNCISLIAFMSYQLFQLKCVHTMTVSSVLLLPLLFLHTAVDFLFQHGQEEVRGRGRNKEWHLFLLAYTKTAFVSVTMA